MRAHSLASVPVLALAATFASGIATGRLAAQAYVAPTSETVTTRIELHGYGTGVSQVIWVHNGSTVPIDALSVTLLDCMNVKQDCSTYPLQLRVRPGTSEVLKRVEPRTPTQRFDYRYTFGWRVDSTATAQRAPLSPRSPQEQRLDDDWADLAHYRDANAKLPPPAPGEQRVVFYGNSITEAWTPYFATMFSGKPYVGRGISGQTTPQLLVRFRQDVLALHPAVVVILAGTNDIAGNTGPSTLGMIEDNLASMTEIAHANRIHVVLSSVLPVSDYPWKPGLAPAPKIAALNAWMRTYAPTHDAVYLDYYSALADDRGGMRAGTSRDGVHPTEAGYAIMAPLAERAIGETLMTHP